MSAYMCMDGKLSGLESPTENTKEKMRTQSHSLWAQIEFETKLY